VASLSQGRTAAAQCGLFTHKSVPVIFEPPCSIIRGNSRNSSSSSINFGIISIFANTPPSSVGVSSLQIYVHVTRDLLARLFSKQLNDNINYINTYMKTTESLTDPHLRV